jgi:hypothetical protein
MELSSALVWNVSRSAFKRHKATDENAYFCRDAIVRPSAAKDRTFKTVRPNHGTATGDQRGCQRPPR